MKVMHAWYSQRAADMSGYAIYKDAAGRNVQITAVSEEQDFENTYFWSDKHYCGTVVEFVKSYFTHDNLRNDLPTFLTIPEIERVSEETLAEFRNIFFDLPKKKESS